MISVKLYGRYYNVDDKDGKKKLSPRDALNRAVALKKLGKPYSGPLTAARALPKKKVGKVEVKKLESKPKSIKKKKKK